MAVDVSRQEYDWREPLYRYAAGLKEDGGTAALPDAANAFYFLHTYRDAAAQYEACRRQMDALVKKARKARTLTDTVAACRFLGELSGYPGASEALAEVRARMRRLQKRGEMGRSFRRAFLVLCSAAVIVWWIFQYRQQKDALIRADEAYAAGDYEQALLGYWKVMPGFFYTRAEEKIPGALRGYADALRLEGRFAESIEAYAELKDEESIRDVHHSWGEALEQEQDYPAAYEQYQQAEIRGEEMDPFLVRWSDYEAGRGDPRAALEVMRKVTDTDGYSKRLRELERLRCDAMMEELLSCPIGEEGPRRAREIAEELDDVDSVIRYCEALAEHGIAPGDVFPDGVDIAVFSSGRFQPPKAPAPGEAEEIAEPVREAGEGTEWEIPEGGGLFFKRGTKGPADIGKYEASGTDLLWDGVLIDPEWDSLYHVTLCVEELYRLPEEYRAKSCETCGWIYLADSIYRADGSAQAYRTVPSDSGRVKQVPWEYPFFDAVEAGIFYRCEDAEILSVIDCRTILPENRFVAASADNGPTVRTPREEVDMNLARASREEIMDMFWAKTEAEYQDRVLEEGVVRILENIR